MKRSSSIISILLIVSLLFGSLGTISVSAADPLYTRKDVKAYVFTEDHTETISCLFRNDLPEVPFIDPAEYLSIILLSPFTEKRNDDGTYTVTNAQGYTMEIDPAKDTIAIDVFDEFATGYFNSEGSSIVMTFFAWKTAFYSVLPSAFVLDLSEYNIDIVEENGKVYMPLPVTATMFAAAGLIDAVYFEEDIYFFHIMDNASYYYNVDQSSLYQSLTRSQELADFNYNVICLFADRFYGRPSKAIVYEALENSGLDDVLDTFDENTPVIKQYLKSTDMCDYFNALMMLSYYFDDGGHTFFYYPPLLGSINYPDQPLTQAWIDQFRACKTESAKLAFELYTKQEEYYQKRNAIKDIRAQEYRQYQDEIVKTWDDTGAYLMIHDDMAVFVFDSFDVKTPYDFKEALDIAKEYNVNDFLVDDSCNGGGYVAAYIFMCELITNAKYRTNEYSTAEIDMITKSVIETVSVLDNNLDGVFDDADKDVYYDFNFAILTSSASFSCGNALPADLHQHGIMVLGERSGGGSCNVTHRFMADGYYVSYSEIFKNVLPDGSDMDSGAPVDYQLTTENEDGSKNYTGLYDLDHINVLLSGFYKTVTFLDYDGTVIRSVKYREGEEVIIPQDPTRESDEEHSYRFVGWDKEITAVSDDVVYTAVYEETQRFTPGDVNGDGSVDNKDVVALFKRASGDKTVFVCVVALDVNGDGCFDNKDVVALFGYVSGKGVEISAEPYVPKA